ncbi:MAG: lysine exporter LysO family protein [Bacteroidales bacterium]|nr:lysine exporter LysO family protein [Bacteroidales bacterium]
MLKVVFCMAAGMVLGWLLKIRNIQKPVIVMTWLLLLFLGWEAGGDSQVISALPSIGLDAVVLSLSGVVGSCLFAWVLWRFFMRGGLTGETLASDSDRAEGKAADRDGEAGDEVAADRDGVAGDEVAAERDGEAGRRFRMDAIWSGFGGSLVILGFFVAGICLGLCGILPDNGIVHKLSTFSLCILMLMVGMSVGGNPELVSSLRSMDPKLLLLPVATILGTYSGCAVADIFLDYRLSDALAISSGFGYYSLSSVLISQSRGAMLGTIALITNIIREVFTLLAAGLLVRIAGPLAPITAGGATTADTTLPIISSVCGQQFVLIAVFHGFIVDFSVPFLVSFFCSL